MAARFFYEDRYQVVKRTPRLCRKSIFGHDKIHISERVFAASDAGNEGREFVRRLWSGDYSKVIGT